jgi:hypothetical protein
VDRRRQRKFDHGVGDDSGIHPGSQANAEVGLAYGQAAFTLTMSWPCPSSGMTSRVNARSAARILVGDRQSAKRYIGIAIQAAKFPERRVFSRSWLLVSPHRRSMITLIRL